jgi:hypothetical protein
MTYYEIYNIRGRWEIWKCTNNGISCTGELFKIYKTKTGAENWAKKIWDRVTWQ